MQNKKYIINLLFICLTIIIETNSQDFWSYPSNIIHQFIEITAINNPTSGIAVTTASRTYSTNVTFTSTPKIMVGIAGIQFTPASSLSYFLNYTTTITTLILKLNLTYPTAFSKITVCYLAQSSGNQFYDNYILIGVSGTPIFENLPTNFATTTGTRTVTYSYQSSLFPGTRGLQKCYSNLLGFTGSSTTQYQYSVDCQSYEFGGVTSNNIYFLQAITLYNNTFGTKLYSNLIIYDRVTVQMNKNTSVTYADSIVFSSGVSSQVTPSYNPALNSCFFGSSYLTHRVAQLYTFSFNYTSPLNSNFSFNFLSIPSTNLNRYIVLMLSTKTCSNTSTFLSRPSFQCLTNSIYTCYPEYYDISTNQTVGVYQIKISKSNRFMAVCFEDRVSIYRHDGVSYVKIQTLLMSTNCRGIDINANFSLLAIVGTNLFQVYTFNSGYFINFYIFPSQLGMSYNNAQVSLSADGMKAVISTAVTTGGNTYKGHYYFVYNLTLNQYVYKRFEASNANDAYFSVDGKFLYVINSKRMIAYKEKSEYMLGNFIDFYQIDLLQGYISPYTTTDYVYSGYSGLSYDMNVMAIYIQFKGIKIYHYDHISSKFILHSTITNIYSGKWSDINLRLDEYGLNMLVVLKGSSIVLKYSRTSLNSQFILSSNLFGVPTNPIGAAIYSFDSTIVVLGNYYNYAYTRYIRIYTCGSSIDVSSIPIDGNNLINQAAVSFQSLVNYNTYSNSGQSISSEINNTINNLKTEVSAIKNQSTAILTVVGIMMAVVIALSVAVFLLFKKLSLAHQKTGSQLQSYDKQSINNLASKQITNIQFKEQQLTIPHENAANSGLFSSQSMGQSSSSNILQILQKNNIQNVGEVGNKKKKIKRPNRELEKDNFFEVQASL